MLPDAVAEDESHSQGPGQEQDQGRAGDRHHERDEKQPPVANRGSSRQHPRWFWWAIGGAMLLTGTTIGVLLVVLRAKPVSRPPRPTAPLVETSRAKAQREALQIRGHGVVQPREQLALSAQVSGEVTKIHPSLVLGGSFVQGDVLIEVEPPRHEANLEQARANLRSTQASLELARSELARTRQLFEQGYAPEAELDSNIARVQELKASVEALKAQLETLELDYKAAYIEAPFDGRVLEESVAMGQIVAPGQTLAQIYPTDAYEVVTRLEGRQAALVEGLWQAPRPGRDAAQVEAVVLVEHAGTHLTWPGYVDRVTGTYDQQAQTIGVVVRIPAPMTSGTPLRPTAEIGDSVPLLPGRFVTVMIEGQAQEDLVKIPRRALHRNDEVWEVRDGRVQVHEVEVVYRDGDVIYVRSDGVTPGDRLITTDLEVVTEGMKVCTAAPPPGVEGQPA